MAGQSPQPSGAPAAADVTVDQLLARACEHEAAGRLHDAEQLVAQVLAACPQHPDALHLSALVAHKRGQFELAIDLAEQAIALNPSASLYHRNICEFYRTIGRLDEAVAAAKRAAELQPDDAHAYYNLAIIHYDRLELDETIACNEKSLALDPTVASADFELSEALLLQGNFQRGWEEYEWRFQIPSATGSEIVVEQDVTNFVAASNRTLLQLGLPSA